ncbi:MAG: N-acetyl-alpha-D-glucosaminyl L-malate synthase BshA [Flavobacteriales bacterium]|nr:N-acetyl-alpha-D-glucosaminyl L-malate synthase BshA [Flavobacteriales bacterium]NQX96583.1 N-acetyl-alpha-D-glucosaminyl L-malate synthase BshA [Flavobacteriales bacterium]
MNIGIVCYPTFGGSGVVATELGKSLAAKGHKIHFITYQQPVRLDLFSENIFYHEVKVSDYPLFDYQPYELVLTSKLVDVVKFEKLDILHVHYAIPHASAAYMAQRILQSEGINIPFITTLHGTDITLVGKDSSFAPVITFAINKSNAVTAVSESLKQSTLEHFDVKREIEVIPNFICLEHYNLNGSIDKLKQSFAPNNERILVHVSNFRKVKRTKDVIRIFDIVRKKVPAKLLMVGDGPERHHLEELCRDLETCHLVKFVGKVKDTERILAASDVFILPSESESFGLAALEAMAAKTPVISTNTGGIPEVNKHGVSGFLSNVGDVEDMANNTLKILESEDSLAKFKAGAYEQAKKFDIHTVLPQYEKLYKSLIN